MNFDQSYINEQLLLSTKISIPRLPLEYVNRPRLTGLINRGVLGPMTLLAAPAGYGKTNLLIEWIKETDLPVAWINIDSDDNDINRFFTYLIGALQTIEPQLGKEALDFIQSTRSSGTEVGLTLLINEITALSKDIVLVLDDFQTLKDSVILQNIGFFLKHLPYNLHLVIASRSEPALDLALLRAKGRVIELGADDLRFTGEEIELFFRQTMGLQLPNDTIHMLEERTDGWITALQMAAVSIRRQADPAALFSSFHGDAYYLVDFLAEEVLDRQPDEIRQFLLRSSILNTLTGSLCEAVVKPEAQPGYGTVMLDRLENARLFITALDEKHEWFRFHHLFADFLRHIQAEINPKEIPVLQKRAALWFEKNANLDEAFQYALASGDMEWTANLIERNIEMVIQTGGVFSLTRCVSKLPDELIHQHPRISLAYAWGLIAGYQLDLARYWIDDVQRLINQFEEQTETAQSRIGPKITLEIENTGLWNIRGGLATCQSTLAMISGDVEQAAKFSKQATSYLQKENPFVNSFLSLDDSLYYVFSGDTQKAIESLRETIRISRQANNLMVAIIAICELAETQTLQGQLSLALATLQKAKYMAVGPDGKSLSLVGLVDIEVGEILFERDLLEEANIYLEQGCQITQPLWSISSLDGMVSLARLRQTLGDFSGSQTVIAEASRMALSTESSQWDDAIISAVAVRLALLRDDLVAAEQWWVKGGFPDITETIALEKYPYHIFEYLQLTQARFLLVKGQDTRNVHYLQYSLDLLETLLFEAERLQRITSQIEILLLQSMDQFVLGDNRAKDTMMHALSLGEPEGFRRIYLDEGERIAELLIQCQSSQRDSASYLPSSDFINQLLEAISRKDNSLKNAQHRTEQRAKPTITETEDGFPISLSAREMEVLVLIAEGKSNQEISSQLYLALNTVKRHAYNIYAKLDVRKRTQAVSKARQLGLIS